jgi:hypothetical protein
MGAYDRPVEADAEVLAELRHRYETDLDSRELGDYARTLGVVPPAEPAGYQRWDIVEKFPDEDYDHGVLYWWGPEEDHGEEDYPEEPLSAPSAEEPPTLGGSESASAR